MKNPRMKAFVSIVSAAPILYLVGLTVSFLLYLVFPMQLVPMNIEPTTLWIGAVMIVLATGLVFWAQGISRRGTHLQNPKLEDFMHGPYRFMRHPGALGLMMMFIGFALVVNSVVMVGLWMLFVILETVWFIPMEEATYMDENPEAYKEYRRKVRMWL